MKISVIFLTFIALIGCDFKANVSSEENGFKFFDEHTQMMFVDALKKSGVQFRTNEDGTVLYSSQDEAKVERLRFSVLKASFTPSIHYEDKDIEKRFLERLETENIAFGIEIREGKRWITWAEQDDKKVEIIRKSL